MSHLYNFRRLPGTYVCEVISILAIDKHEGHNYRMKNYTVVLLLAGVIGGLFSWQTAYAQTSEVKTASLSWLNGSWSGEFGGGMFYESWKTVGDRMEGEGYMVMGGDTVESETLVIQTVGKHFVYIASINEAPPTLFSLNKTDGSTWTFENPEHDFPQRVVYTRKSNQELHIVVDGVMNGEQQQLEFMLHRNGK